jgi:hypothetical protein
MGAAMSKADKVREAFCHVEPHYLETLKNCPKKPCPDCDAMASRILTASRRLLAGERLSGEAVQEDYKAWFMEPGCLPEDLYSVACDPTMRKHAVDFFLYMQSRLLGKEQT